MATVEFVPFVTVHSDLAVLDTDVAGLFECAQRPVGLIAELPVDDHGPVDLALE